MTIKERAAQMAERLENDEDFSDIRILLEYLENHLWEVFHQQKETKGK